MILNPEWRSQGRLGGLIGIGRLLMPLVRTSSTSTSCHPSTAAHRRRRRGPGIIWVMPHSPYILLDNIFITYYRYYMQIIVNGHHS